MKYSTSQLQKLNCQETCIYMHACACSTSNISGMEKNICKSNYYFYDQALYRNLALCDS